MPTYLLTSPEGKQYRVTGNGTGEEALAHLQSQLGGAQAEQAAPFMQRATAEQNAQPLKDYEAKKAQYGIPSPLDLLSGAADKLGLGATGQYVDLGLRATADLPIGIAQTVTDLVAPDSLMAEALNKVAADTDRLQAQTPYGALIRGATQVAQTLPVGGGILSSTASGGLQPVSGENADARNIQRLQNAGTGAAFGVVAKGAAPVIEGAINKGSRFVSKGLDYVSDSVPMVKGAADAMRAATPKLPVRGQELKDLTEQAYTKAAQTGGVLPPAVTDSFIAKLEALRPAPIAGKVVPSEDKVLLDIIDEYAPLKGSPLNFDDVKRLDQSFGDKITMALSYGNKPLVRSLTEVQKDFRKLIDDTAQGLPELAEARRLAAASFKMDDIEKIMQRAEMSNNPAQAARTAFSNLYNNAKKTRGYTKEELALIKQAGEGSLTMEVLRGIGSRLGQVISLATGGNPAQTAALAVSSAGARKLMEKSQLAKGDKIIEAISNRAMPKQSTLIGNASKGINKAIQLAPRTALPSVTAQPPMVQTPPILLPGATKPSTMAVQPLEEILPQALPEVGPQSSIEGVISEAAQIGGASPDLLQGIAQIESGMNPEAKAKTSSASGLFQITAPTWKALVMRYGKQHGFGMGDILNPQANAKAAALLTAENNQKLATKLGREPDAAEIYTAHFMGANKAIKLLNAGPREIAAKLFPAEAKANKPIFYYKDGKPRDVMAVRMLLSDKINGAIKQQNESRMQAEQQAKMAEEQARKNAVLQSMASKIPQESIQALRGNPSLAGDFNQMYGEGASSLFLT